MLRPAGKPWRAQGERGGAGLEWGRIRAGPVNCAADQLVSPRTCPNGSSWASGGRTAWWSAATKWRMKLRIIASCGLSPLSGSAAGVRSIQPYKIGCWGQVKIGCWGQVYITIQMDWREDGVSNGHGKAAENPSGGRVIFPADGA